MCLECRDDRGFALPAARVAGKVQFSKRQTFCDQLANHVFSTSSSAFYLRLASVRNDMELDLITGNPSQSTKLFN